MNITGRLMSIDEASRLIEEGRTLLAAGEASVLEGLPRGNWIGGTIPYFMTEDGGVADGDRVFVNVLPQSIAGSVGRLYDIKTLPQIYSDAPAHGTSFVIIPASSEVHLAFAQDVIDYPGYPVKPLAGWIAGVHLDKLGRAAPRVFLGSTGESSEQHAVALHATLPDSVGARIDIVNIFTQGDGDTLMFENDGFSATRVLVNGEPTPFAKYLKDKGIDIRLPLVASYYGAMINVSFQGIDEDTGQVSLYAPVFKGVEYKTAKPIEDYQAAFDNAIPAEAGDAVFSCNCILNYLYAELEGKHTADAVGPITFGEVAYQLLNQTLVYVSFEGAA